MNCEVLMCQSDTSLKWYFILHLSQQLSWNTCYWCLLLSYASFSDNWKEIHDVQTFASDDMDMKLPAIHKCQKIKLDLHAWLTNQASLFNFWEFSWMRSRISDQLSTSSFNFLFFLGQNICQTNHVHLFLF